jgi:hypothetical protein
LLTEEKIEADVIHSSDDDGFTSLSLNEADFGWSKKIPSLNK